MKNRLTKILNRCNAVIVSRASPS